MKTVTNKMQKQRMMIIGVLDVLSILCSYFFALFLRFDMRFSNIDVIFLEGYQKSILIWCAASLVVFFICRLYHSIWSQVSLAELQMICKAYLVLLPVYFAINMLLNLHMPRSYYVMGYIISFCATTAIRFSYRMIRLIAHNFNRSAGAQENRIMVIGAGAAGQMLIKELENSDKLISQVCCVIDDNPNKLGRFIEGVEIVGNRYDIKEMAVKYKINRIIFAIPTIDGEERKAILNICKMTNCKLQTIPGMYQLVNDEVSITRLRDVDLSDLLGRQQVQVNNDEILADIAGKTVLVTGGGGSIGSELCRQIARSQPKQLIIFDIYENNAYNIEQELKRNHPELNLQALIGSVRNTNRINYVMSHYKPDIVFHAAAHKHVPLMENSPNEAIKNNVLGTYKTAQAAAENGVKKFVLISTDKAVNPTNIMGASKRLCEMVVQMMDRQSENTSFVAVRFGNVLGSNGSVIPLFKQQIAEGGPVTVTDKRIIRYFMTIQEASQLVIQAGAMARRGELFVLNMGKPVKIYDLAENMIRLSGLEPGKDIQIKETGLRPGEKMYEELLIRSEVLDKTENEMIFIERDTPLARRDVDNMVQQLRAEAAAWDRGNGREARQVLKTVVPSFRDPEELNRMAESARQLQGVT